jgi:hypothetical protein
MSAVSHSHIMHDPFALKPITSLETKYSYSFTEICTCVSNVTFQEAYSILPKRLCHLLPSFILIAFSAMDFTTICHFSSQKALMIPFFSSAFFPESK